MDPSTSLNTSYTYTPLGEDSFRVIEIVAVEPTTHVRLVEHPDDDPKVYHALSYAWGTGPNTEIISCDGADFKITTHLRDGLRSIYKALGCTRLWVDAICIDQTSDSEKKTQVAKMHRIYQRAAGVYVWMGTAESRSDDAMDAFNAVEIPHRPPPSREELFERVLHLKSGANQLFALELFEPIAALSRRSWFRRLWIAQEYFYGKSVWMVCGDKVLDADKLVKVIRNMSIYSFGDEEPDVAGQHELFRGYQALMDLDKLKIAQRSGQTLSFFDFVMLGRNRLAKEPVDRIFAAFGMAEGIDRVYRDQIAIDYSPEARENYWRLYTRFGKIALRHEPKLRLLSLTSSEQRPKELPSWCPNLNSPHDMNPIDDTGVYAAGWPGKEHMASDTCNRHAGFKSNDESHVSVSLDSGSDAVSFVGVRIGRIAATSGLRRWDADINTENLESIQELASAMLVWLEESEAFCKKHGRHECDPATGRAVWAEILCGATSEARRRKSGMHSGGSVTPATDDNADPPNEAERTPNAPDGQPDSPPTETETRDEFDDFLKLTLRALSLLDDANKDSDFGSSILQNFHLLWMWILTTDLLWDSRVLFATDDGYLGFASEHVEIGDSVCVFYGGSTLYILRDQGGSCQFVADAYVWDMMNGQVFELLDGEEMREEAFTVS
ncbi:hypothetical protein OQA88_3434 [Cercophora sp. LCS_1]